jgi:transposase-like protein
MKSTSGLFKWKHFEAEIILLTVRWYLQYRLSYRDLVEIMSERVLVQQLKLIKDIRDFVV